jgi:hypothetical protein
MFTAERCLSNSACRQPRVRTKLFCRLHCRAAEPKLCSASDVTHAASFQIDLAVDVAKGRHFRDSHSHLRNIEKYTRAIEIR